MDQVSQNQSTPVSEASLHGAVVIPEPKSKSRKHHCQTRRFHGICIHKIFALAMTAPRSLPCISVAAYPNGIGELCFESWESTEPAREDEIEKAPQFAQVVLDRGSCEDQTVHRPDLLTDESHLQARTQKTRILWCKYFPRFHLPLYKIRLHYRCEAKNRKR